MNEYQFRFQNPLTGWWFEELFTGENEEDARRNAVAKYSLSEEMEIESVTFIGEVQ